MDAQTRLKHEAALRAADLVQSGMVVGLGTGSTATLFIAELIARAKLGLKIRCIPTSERSDAQARAGGLDVIGFDQVKKIDLAVDGADEIAEGSLDLIKGLGAALLREKIVASAAAKFVVIADETKWVKNLGTKAPVPVEVTKFGHELTASRLADLGARPVLRLAGDAPLVTDGGNFIVDCFFAPIAEPAELNRAIRSITGVVDTGIFAAMTSLVLLAGTGGVREFTPG
jgi:ribose 5-phosphate isomerase A